MMKLLGVSASIGACVLLVSLVQTDATVLFQGDFGVYASSTDLDTWTFGNNTGIYQAYIFAQPGFLASQYINIQSQFCNKAFNPSCGKGAQYMINGSSSWHNQTLHRTELIPNNPQPTASGRRLYRFSMRVDNLTVTYEHQLVFFESHFIEIKYGETNLNVSSHLQFFIGGNLQWSTPANGLYHNFAFDVNYDAKTAGLWWSTGGDALKQVVPATTNASGAATSDFHIGILRVPLGGNGIQENDTSYVTYSNVFIEDSLSTLTKGAAGIASLSVLMVFLGLTALYALL